MYFPGDQVASGQFYGALFTVAGVTMFLVAAAWPKVEPAFSEQSLNKEMLAKYWSPNSDPSPQILSTVQSGASF